MIQKTLLIIRQNSLHYPATDSLVKPELNVTVPISKINHVMNILNLSLIYMHVSGILLMPSKASEMFY